MSILIFGHKNPDTDTICSAIAYSKLKNKLGIDAKPVRLGEINEETKYVIDYFNMDIPEIIEKTKELKALIEEKNPDVLIEIDGGVKSSNIKEIVDAGADVLVAGSAIFGHDDINKAVRDLREAAQGK